MLKLLHTSDWHLGRSLYGRKRYEEFTAFLDWLGEAIEDNSVDVLLVAGDVFDTSTPSNRTQELYYRFLCRVAASSCRHVVIIAGNHDSPTFLDAPRELLRVLDVHVIGSMTDPLENEVIVLHNDDRPEAIICAVPYLRDRDIRTVDAGETIADKNTKLLEGLKSHYEYVCSVAAQKQSEFSAAGFGDVPIVAMGHLFTAGGQTTEDDGVRDLYVGGLAQLRREAFPASIDYMALGHLHVPQKVAGEDHIRYSGSPIPMGYGEAKQEKKVILIEFSAGQRNIEELPVPCFQQLVRIAGSLDDIHQQLRKLKEEGSAAWLEIEYTGNEITGNLREGLHESIEGSSLEILKVKNRRMMEKLIASVADNKTLDDLGIEDVFERCLDDAGVPEDEREELMMSYKQIIQSIEEEDVNAE